MVEDAIVACQLNACAPSSEFPAADAAGVPLGVERDSPLITRLNAFTLSRLSASRNANKCPGYANSAPGISAGGHRRSDAWPVPSSDMVSGLCPAFVGDAFAAAVDDSIETTESFRSRNTSFFGS